MDRVSSAIAQNPEGTNEVPQEVYEDVTSESELPHVTHDLKQLRSAEVVYCNNCGLWSMGNRTRTRNLWKNASP